MIVTNTCNGCVGFTKSPVISFQTLLERLVWRTNHLQSVGRLLSFTCQCIRMLLILLVQHRKKIMKGLGPWLLSGQTRSCFDLSLEHFMTLPLPIVLEECSAVHHLVAGRRAMEGCGKWQPCSVFYPQHESIRHEGEGGRTPLWGDGKLFAVLQFYCWCYVCTTGGHDAWSPNCLSFVSRLSHLGNKYMCEVLSIVRNSKASTKPFGHFSGSNSPLAPIVYF